MSGVMVVNADDWGGFREGTDAIAAAFRAGAITSSTAMVHMADSRRAGELARELGLPLGLHLNLTQGFDGPDVPAATRARHDRLRVRYWPTTRGRRWRYDPRPSTARLVRDVFDEQLDAFRATYGTEPTHVDSHHHAHAIPDVFLRLPRGLRVRRTGARHAALLARRFRTTDAFHEVRRLVPDLGGSGIGAVVAAAGNGTSVEVMVHPSFPHELPVLLGDAWLGALAAAPLGTFLEIGHPLSGRMSA